MKIKPKLKKELKKYLLQKIKEESQRAVLITSNKLDAEELQQIKEKFPTIRQKKLSLIVDDELLGGFVLKEGSKITDFSLKTKLNQIKKNINEIT